MKDKIQITCGYQRLAQIDNLKNFQGGLKELSLESADKLKQSILKHGFTAPVFVWDGNILDGHQRLSVLRSMIKSGYAIDGIPVIEIKAKNKSDAAEKLLAINSRYARVTEDGLMTFLDEMEIDIWDIDYVELPEFDVDGLKGEDPDIIENNSLENSKADHFYGASSRGFRLGDIMAYITDDALIEKIQSFTDKIIAHDESQAFLNDIGTKISEWIIKNENLFLPGK
jgi:hypothetical protein